MHWTGLAPQTRFSETRIREFFAQHKPTKPEDQDLEPDKIVGLVLGYQKQLDKQKASYGSNKSSSSEAYQKKLASTRSKDRERTLNEKRVRENGPSLPGDEKVQERLAKKSKYFKEPATPAAVASAQARVEDKLPDMTQAELNIVQAQLESAQTKGQVYQITRAWNEKDLQSRKQQDQKPRRKALKKLVTAVRGNEGKEKQTAPPKPKATFHLIRDTRHYLEKRGVSGLSEGFLRELVQQPCAECDEPFHKPVRSNLDLPFSESNIQPACKDHFEAYQRKKNAKYQKDLRETKASKAEKEPEQEKKHAKNFKSYSSSSSSSSASSSSASSSSAQEGERVSSVIASMHTVDHEMNPSGQSGFLLNQIQCPPETFVSRLLSLSCSYCGESGDGENLIGVDRIDSTKNYLIDNIAPACNQCNMSKCDMKAEDFIKHCQRVAVCAENAEPDRCRYCSSPDPSSPDQRVPRGGYHLENVDLICWPCNKMKKIMLPEVFQAFCKRVSRYQLDNPWDLTKLQSLIHTKILQSEGEYAERMLPKIVKPPFQYTNTRPEGDLQVASVAYNKVYHTPPNSTTYLCLKGKDFKGSVKYQDAIEMLAKNWRPCRLCRKDLTPREHEYLNRQKTVTKSSSAGNCTGRSIRKIYRNDPSVYENIPDAPESVFIFYEDPWYHSDSSCVQTLFDNAYTETIFRDVGERVPCKVCRKFLCEEEPKPDLQTMKKATLVRKRVYDRLRKKQN